ncbi:MAG: hypothetical protein WC551_13830 [Patescibacteria group bacterium]|jgi:hypothetical protein
MPNLAIDEMLWLLRWYAQRRDRTLRDLQHALMMGRWLLAERRKSQGEAIN